MFFSCCLFCCWFLTERACAAFQWSWKCSRCPFTTRERPWLYIWVSIEGYCNVWSFWLYYFFTFSCISCFSLFNKVFVGLPVAEPIKFLVESGQKIQSWGCITQKGCVSPPPAMGTIIWLLSGELVSVINK